MPTILMVAFHFPPQAGAGVQRTLKFTRYLPENGWAPIILTVKNPTSRQQDISFIDEIPAQTAVLRTPACLMPTWFPWRVRNWVARWILSIDEQIGWIPFAVSAGKKIIQEQSPAVIYTTSAPYSGHLIGLALKRATGVPWLADFRDPWVGNFSSSFPSPFHEALARRLEQAVVLSADAVAVVSEPMKQALCERIPQLPADKVQVIPNGFDPADFAGLGKADRPAEKMVIVYNGSFYSQGRTAEAILQGVRQALDGGTIPAGKLLLRFIGNTGKDLVSLVGSLGLDEVVEICGYLPHKESLTHLAAADILLLIIGSGPGSEAVYTGKLFEYLAADKTILCLAQDGAAARLIREAQAGVIVPPEDIPAIANALGQLYRNWSGPGLKITPDLDVIARYNRQIQTRHLSEVLDKISRPAAN